MFRVTHIALDLSSLSFPEQLISTLSKVSDARGWCHGWHRQPVHTDCRQSVTQQVAPLGSHT